MFGEKVSIKTMGILLQMHASLVLTKQGKQQAIRSFSGANSACRTPIAVACSISDSSAALDRVVRFGYSGNL